MNRRENTLRAVRFDRPEYIPMSFHINPACWHAYPQEALQELMAGHPFLFPDFEPSLEPIVPKYGPNQRAGEPYTDDWGCRWETTYQRLMQPAREAGFVVHMHSDGDIRALVDDLIEGGVQVINLQDLVNGIEWIAFSVASYNARYLELHTGRVRVQ